MTMSQQGRPKEQERVEQDTRRLVRMTASVQNLNPNVTRGVKNNQVVEMRPCYASSLAPQRESCPVKGIFYPHFFA
jgi:hypothetical protein